MGVNVKKLNLYHSIVGNLVPNQSLRNTFVFCKIFSQIRLDKSFNKHHHRRFVTRTLS